MTSTASNYLYGFFFYKEAKKHQISIRRHRHQNAVPPLRPRATAISSST
jgi:hypothetical protein